MQLAIFVLVNIVGLSIGLICLYTSREILGYTTPLADNISANFVGLILGTTFRFLASRKWVFTI
jgi:putative flippase GtrA